MGITTYDIAVIIIVLCVIVLVTLVCWLLSFIFQKLNLTAISNFFTEIKWLLILLLIMLGAVAVAVSVGIGLYLISTHIADFIFALF